MKKLVFIFISLFLFVNVCLADISKPLTITFKNTTNVNVLVQMFSIDHGLKFKGKAWVVCVLLKANDVFILRPRNHNIKPYRYIIQYSKLNGNNWIIFANYMTVIPPVINKKIFKIKIEK